MILGELIAGVDVRVTSGEGHGFADVRVCDLTEDSRTVVPGSLFVARQGTKADGKAYLSQALEAGAVAVLTDDASLRPPQGFDVPVLYSPDVERACGLIAEKFYGSAASKLKLVGVTGTNGKTTTTFLVWQLLNGAGIRCGLVGTVLVDDGVEVAPAAMTTPPAIEISRTLAMMVEAGCKAATLEVSSHALDQKRADALPFAAAVFTNLTGDHLDYHKTMDAYAAAKARLFEMLAPGATAIVNAGDAASVRMLKDCKAKAMRCAVVAGDATCRGRWSARAQVIGRINQRDAAEADGAVGDGAGACAADWAV